MYRKSHTSKKYRNVDNLLNGQMEVIFGPELDIDDIIMTSPSYS